MKKGDIIRELREKHDMTLEELAKQLKTTKQTINKYEMGIITNIPSDKIEKMSLIFNVSPAYIMGWEDNLDMDTDIIPEMMKDENTINHIAALLKLNQENQKSVFDMIDFLTKKEGH